jgi:hypothetical protein
LRRSSIRRIAMDAIAAGYAVSVNDGEETTVDRSTRVKAIIAAVQSTDEDYLLLHRPDPARNGEFESESFAWIKLVYGNGRSRGARHTAVARHHPQSHRRPTTPRDRTTKPSFPDRECASL